MSKYLVIAVDFDGTCVHHRYPYLGKDAPGAVDVLRKITDAGHRIVLLTMRDGFQLLDAVSWFKGNGIPLFGINENPEQDWTTSRNVYANLYIDDAALGVLLIRNGKERPYVDWAKVEELLVEQGVLKPLKF